MSRSVWVWALGVQKTLEFYGASPILSIPGIRAASICSKSSTRHWFILISMMLFILAFRQLAVAKYMETLVILNPLCPNVILREQTKTTLENLSWIHVRLLRIITSIWCLSVCVFNPELNTRHINKGVWKVGWQTPKKCEVLLESTNTCAQPCPKNTRALLILHRALGIPKGALFRCV